jgi:hypothetical protein
MPGRSTQIGWAFCVFGEDPKRTMHPSPARFAHELWMAGKEGEPTVVPNRSSGNQFREEPITDLTEDFSQSPLFVDRAEKAA